jgi:tetratricopeptide (TPR) repeat protein
MWFRGRLAEAVDRMERSFQVLAGEEPDEDLATLAAQLGRLDFFAGRVEAASGRIESAIDIAESLWLPEVLSQALTTQAIILYSARGRRRQGFALLKYALEVALENDLPSAALRAYFNLADLAAQGDRYDEGRGYVDLGLSLARRIGNRDSEWLFLGQAYPHFASGEWDLALEMAGGIPVEKVVEARLAGSALLLIVPLIRVNRGEIEEAQQAFSLFPDVESSADVQELAAHAAGRSVLHLARGDLQESLDAARDALSVWDEVGPAAEQSKEALLAGLEAAFRLEDAGTVEELLGMIERIPRGKRPQFLEAHAMRFRARLGVDRQEEESVGRLFKGAAGLLREIAAPFHMAVTLLEHGEWLISRSRIAEAEPLLSEAREIFERLKAQPWLDRLERSRESVTQAL